MGLTTLHYLYGIQLPSGAWITQLNDTTPSTNLRHITGRNADGVLPDFRGGHGATPDITFTTPQIKTVLDACGIYGLDMSGSNCDLYYRAATDLGTRESVGDTDHLRMRCVRALLYWTGFSAAQNGEAQINCRIIPTYDGSNPPFVPAGSVTIPGADMADEYFGLGPVKINGSWVYGITDWNLELNPNVHEEGADGEDYISWAGVETHDPIVMVNTRTKGWWSTIGVGGLALTGLNAFLRKKKADNTGAELDASAVHIAVTASNGLATLTSGSGGIAGTGPASVGLRIALRRSTSSGSDALAISTGSAIA